MCLFMQVWHSQYMQPREASTYLLASTCMFQYSIHIMSTLTEVSDKEGIEKDEHSNISNEEYSLSSDGDAEEMPSARTEISGEAMLDDESEQQFDNRKVADQNNVDT